MNQFSEEVNQKINTALEAVEYTEKNINNQVNKTLLPSIREIVVDIKNGDFVKFF